MRIFDTSEVQRGEVLENRGPKGSESVLENRRKGGRLWRCRLRSRSIGSPRCNALEWRLDTTLLELGRFSALSALPCPTESYRRVSAGRNPPGPYKGPTLFLSSSSSDERKYFVRYPQRCPFRPPMGLCPGLDIPPTIYRTLNPRTPVRVVEEPPELNLAPN